MNCRAIATSRRLLVLAILAVVFHALMPLVMALPARIGVVMPMCSALGAKSVFVQFDTDGKGPPGKDLQARCPLCLAGAHFALTPPEEARPAAFSGLRHVQICTPLRQAQPAAVEGAQEEPAPD